MGEGRQGDRRAGRLDRGPLYVTQGAMAEFTAPCMKLPAVAASAPPPESNYRWLSMMVPIAAPIIAPKLKFAAGCA